MIDVRGVTVRYGGMPVLAGVDLLVEPGQCVGIAGASGAGKSTLLRVLLGEQVADAGSVAIGCWSPGRGSPQPPAGLIGVVYQDPVASLDRLWPVGRCVAEPLAASGNRERGEAAARVGAMLGLVRLGHVPPETRITRLSVGQAQRVAMARALIHHPAAILADEPTSALDPTTAASVVRLLRGAADEGAAVLVVSHNRPLLRTLCDRVLVLSGGVLRAE